MKKKYLSFLIPLLLCFLLFGILGSFYSDYDTLIYLIGYGIYTDYPFHDFIIDTYFLIGPYVAFINSRFPELQFLDIFSLTMNIAAITVLGSIVFKKLIVRQYQPLFYFTYFLIFIILFSDHILNLNTTRIVFLGMAGVLMLDYFVRSRSWRHYFAFCSSIILLSLLRLDAALLSAVIYTLFILTLGTFRSYRIIPLIITLFVFALFHFLVVNFTSEAKQMFYYSELDMFDRNNIAYSRLSEQDALVISLLRYQIFDTYHFSREFVNKVIDYNINPFLNGILPRNFISTFKESLSDYRNVMPLLITAVLLSIIYLGTSCTRLKHKLFVGFYLFLPLLINLYIITPTRFLAPYYTLVILITLINIKGEILENYKFIILLIVTFGLSLRSLMLLHLFYTQHVSQSTLFQNKLDALEAVHQGQPIILERFAPENDFPNPLDKMKRRNMAFLNMFYLASFECYQSRWKRLCQCNPLSLREKMSYIANQQVPFVSVDFILPVYEKYFCEMYGLTIRFTKQQNLMKRWNVYKVELSH